MTRDTTRIRRERRQRGLCSRCGQPSPTYRCKACTARHVELSRTSDAHREGMRAAQNRLQGERRAHGLCPRCGGSPIPGKVTCEACLDRIQRRRQPKVPRREQILALLGQGLSQAEVARRVGLTSHRASLGANEG